MWSKNTQQALFPAFNGRLRVQTQRIIHGCRVSIWQTRLQLLAITCMASQLASQDKHKGTYIDTSCRIAVAPLSYLKVTMPGTMKSKKALKHYQGS